MLGYDFPQEVLDSITDIKGQLHVDPDRSDFVMGTPDKGGRKHIPEIELYKKGWQYDLDIRKLGHSL